jgi:hypothetical protein
MSGRAAVAEEEVAGRCGWVRLAGCRFAMCHDSVHEEGLELSRVLQRRLEHDRLLLELLPQ